MKLTSSILGIFPETYLVGGALRDALLKLPFKDIDLAVPPSPDFAGRVQALALGKSLVAPHPAQSAVVGGQGHGPGV